LKIVGTKHKTFLLKLKSTLSKTVFKSIINYKERERGKEKLGKGKRSWLLVLERVGDI
jgi:hypothetical protein